jgi:hypothetical protein
MTAEQEFIVDQLTSIAMIELKEFHIRKAEDRRKEEDDRRKKLDEWNEKEEFKLENHICRKIADRRNQDRRK